MNDHNPSTDTTKIEKIDKPKTEKSTGPERYIGKNHSSNSFQKAPKLNKANKEKLYICTYNARTLMEEANLLELEYALQFLKYDIIGLAEIRRAGKNIDDRGDYILYSYGEKKGIRGVGFLVKKCQANNVDDFESFSDRVCMINYRSGDFKCTLIQAHAPTEKSNDEEVKLFYKDIRKALTKSCKNVMILGDFNAQVGQPKIEESIALGRFGYGERSPRGEMLLNFALENKFKIMNTVFRKKLNRRWTWLSPDGQTKNEIDYILSNFGNQIDNIDILNSLKHHSDHRMVRATLNANNTQTITRRFFKRAPEIHTINNNFSEKLHDKIVSINAAEQSVQQLYDKIEQAIIFTANREKSRIGSKKDVILSDSTKKLIEKRQRLKNKISKTRKEKTELSKLYRKTKDTIKRDLQDYRLKILEENLLHSGAIKKAQKILARNKPVMASLANRKGEIKTNREEVVRVATEFYSDLYSSNDQRNYHSEKEHYSCSEINVEPINNKEIVFAFKNLKKDKSPGPDKLRNEILISGKAALLQPLTDVFNKILMEKQIPEQWTDAHITLIYKKGDPNDIGNYRPISLMSNIYKIFANIIRTRITPDIDKNQPPEQAGFMKSFSTIDHIHSISQLIEKHNEFQLPLYLGFIDYKKAFDCISHNSIWQALEEQGIKKDYIDLIKKIYKNSTARVKTQTLGPQFPINRGVRQGDPMSPKLFLAVLEMIFRKIKWSDRQKGIIIRGHHLSNLRFADDLVIFARSAYDLTRLLQELHSESRKIGLEMSETKTKVMTNWKLTPITIGNTTLEYVKEYIYLGKVISFVDCTKKEVERRIGNTWKRYWSMKEIFKSRLPTNLKKKAADSCLLPCLTYGCQTWQLTKV